MQNTNRQVISDVIGGVKALGYDDRISKRLVLSMLIDKAENFIKQDTDNRRLFKTTNIWKKIDCFKLCETDLMECGCDTQHCSFVMKSINKLPKSFQTGYGDLIKVLTINGAKELSQTSLSAYIDIKNREYSDKNKGYFWIDNDYLYIPDSLIEEVMVIGLFKNQMEVDKLNCNESDCLSPLDAPFPCPDYLRDVVKTAVKNELIRRFGIVTDNHPDNNENTKK